MPQLSRANAVVIHNDAVLLIRRLKYGHRYYVLPGGGVEPGENHEEAAIRELWEETSIKAKIIRLLVQVEFAEGGVLTDYLCEYLEGEPSLGNFNESQLHELGVNEYEPVWVSLDSVPVSLKAGPVVKMIRVYKQRGFPIKSHVIRVEA